MFAYPATGQKLSIPQVVESIDQPVRLLVVSALKSLRNTPLHSRSRARTIGIILAMTLALPGGAHITLGERVPDSR